MWAPGGSDTMLSLALLLSAQCMTHTWMLSHCLNAYVKPLW